MATRWPRWRWVRQACGSSTSSSPAGVQEAAVINKIVTVAKIVPILTFIVVAIFALKAHVFAENWWGGEPKTASALFDQVRATMLITVFVFLGIEGASVYSRYAKRRQDVGKATVVGFLGVLVLFCAARCR